MKKSLLAIVLAIVLIATQFSMLLTVSAETTYTALTGRDDFVFGVNIHPIGNYAAYNDKTYTAIHDSMSLGSNIIRVDGTPSDDLSYAYYKSIGDIAAEKGMDVMLVDTSIINKLKSGDTFVSVEGLNLEAITTYYTELATKLKGSVKYYQLGNEMDNDFYKGSASDHGAAYGNKYYDVTAAAVALDAATKAIKAVDSDAKVVVNFNYYHTGFIHGLKTVDIDENTEGIQTFSFDYIGMDFYSNQIDSSLFSGKDYTDNIDQLAKYDEPIIVTEANITATGWDENNHENVTYDEDADWLADFVTYCYENDDVAGFIAYELYDQPAYSEKGFNNQSFFGLIDKNGVKKDTYNVLQALYGGADVARAEITDAPESLTAGEVVGNLYKGAPVESTVGSTGRLIDVTGIDKVDLTDGGNFSDYTWKGIFEFDLYIEDAELFKTVAEAQGYKLLVQFWSGSADRTALEMPLDKIHNDGWNHITMSVRNFYNGTDAAFKAVDRVAILIHGSDDGKTRNLAVSGMKVAVDNICGTKLVKETESTVGTKIATQFPYSNSSGIFMDNSNRAKILNFPVSKKNLATLNLNDYMKEIDPNRNSISKSNRLYIEFDFYVDDYEAYKNEVNNNKVKFDFMLSSNSNSLEANYLKYNFSNQICKDGWNHIVLEFYFAQTYDAARPYQSSSFDAANVKSYGVMVWPIDKNPDFGKYTYAMTNVIFTKYAAPTNTAEGIVLSSLITTNGKLREFTNRTSGNSSFDSTGMVYRAENLGDFDFSGADNIEFDIFFENYALLNNEIKANDLELVLKLNSDSVLRETTSLEVSFWDKITQPGWNHIVIPVSEWTKSEVAPDMTSISSYKLTFKGESGTNGKGLWYDSATPGTLLGIFNIQATKNFEAPEKLESTYISLGTDKMSVLEFIDDEIDVFQVEDFSETDISSTKMVEFDIYVEDIANVNGVYFYLTDTNDIGIEFDVSAQIMTSGWNHVQFDIEDALIDDSFNYNVKNFGIYTENGFAGYIANVYVADYVLGDANRDGEFDIMDLIRVKKHSLEISNPTTNICAVDFDSDYVIGATDCTNTRKELLKK